NPGRCLACWAPQQSESGKDAFCRIRGGLWYNDFDGRRLTELHRDGTATFLGEVSSVEAGGIDLADGDRIRLAREGDREALVRLLRELEGPVYRTAFYMLGNEHDALDAAQEALLSIYRNLPGYRFEAKVET